MVLLTHMRLAWDIGLGLTHAGLTTGRLPAKLQGMPISCICLLFSSCRACVSGPSTRELRQVSAGVYETAGLRGEDHMEDRHVVVEALGDDAATSLLAVFDGHRGPDTAEFAVQ